MAESNLIKEFKENDIKRIRNLIKGNYNDSNNIQTGYNKKFKKYEENDIWEEDGKKWVIKNGIKISISKIDNVRNLLITPTHCPKCNKVLTHDIDKKFYKLFKYCFDCNLKLETEMKIKGTYENYQNSILKNNIINSLNELENELDDYIESLHNSSIVTENGDLEDWTVVKIDKQKIKEKIREDIDEVKSKIDF